MSSSNNADMDIEKVFPKAKEGNYQKTSLSTIFESTKYNCVAHAAGDNERWWQPPSLGETGADIYWPSGASQEYNLDSYKQAFETQGYQVTDSTLLEAGYEKVALYWGASGPHAAKQLENGKWTSKLGDRQDIEHDTLEVLETDGFRPAYGKVEYVFKRPFNKVQNK